MGLLNSKKTELKPKGLEFTLGTEELRFILEGIQNTTYKGKDIERMYVLVLKLQELYTKSLDNK